MKESFYAIGGRVLLVVNTGLMLFYLGESLKLKNQVKGMVDEYYKLALHTANLENQLEEANKNPSDAACAGWLFNTDLLAAKRKICGK